MLHKSRNLSIFFIFIIILIVGVFFFYEDSIQKTPSHLPSFKPGAKDKSGAKEDLENYKTLIREHRKEIELGEGQRRPGERQRKRLQNFEISQDKTEKSAQDVVKDFSHEIEEGVQEDKKDLDIEHSYLFEEGDFSLFYKDLELDHNPSFQDSHKKYSLEDQLNLQILLDQKKKSYDEDYKKAFIEAFLENAKKRGYLIRLNKNLDVVEIRRIKPRVYSIPDAL